MAGSGLSDAATTVPAGTPIYGSIAPGEVAKVVVSRLATLPTDEALRISITPQDISFFPHSRGTNDGSSTALPAQSIETHGQPGELGRIRRTGTYDIAIKIKGLSQEKTNTAGGRVLARLVVQHGDQSEVWNEAGAN